jgi:hypothetical protein
VTTDKGAALGATIRDRLSGISGTVIGVVSWLHNPVDSLIVQPPAQDGKVPATVYVPTSAAEPMSPPSERVQ